MIGIVRYVDIHFDGYFGKNAFIERRRPCELWIRRWVQFHIFTRGFVLSVVLFDVLAVSRCWTFHYESDMAKLF